MANVLTIIRIIGIFPLFIHLMTYGPNKVNFIIFVILGLTDFLDGFIARHYNKVTNFGKIADGIADKLLMISVTISLLIKKVIPYWTLIIFLREIIALIYSYLYIKKRNIIAKPSIYGKLKTVFHIVSIAFVLLLGKWQNISSIFMIIAILLFIPEFFKRLKELK